MRRSDGQRKANWQGGKILRSDGYVGINLPDHPRANHNGYVLEHVLVVENALGKPLPIQAEVHHVDEDKTHNDNSNLVVCENHAYHKLLHQRMRALDECGDPNAQRCCICHSYERQTEMKVVQGRGKRDWRQAYHQSCNTRKARLRRARLQSSNPDLAAVA